MLSKPKHGWTQVEIGNFSDSASYLTDVPIDCLQSFVSENNLPAAISFDAEGWDFTVVADSSEAHIISGKCDDGFQYSSFEISKKTLAKELINDIHSNIEEWSRYWDTSFGWSEEWTDVDEKAYKARKFEIESLIERLSMFIGS